MLRFINIYFCVHRFFQYLVLFILFFFIGSTYSPDGGFPPDDDGPCECKNGEMVCPATTPKPILLMRGSVKESVTDISIPGHLGGWRHVRDYDSMLDTRTANNPMYNIQGRRWTGGAQMIYLRRNGNTMELHLSASNKRTFIDNDPGKANGSYSGPADLKLNFCKFHNYLYSKELQLVLSISKHFETKYYCNSIYETLDFPAYQFLEKQYAIQ